MQKKKLLLLSAIVLLGTNSYGQTFDVGEHTVSENITVTSGNGHQLNANKEGTLTKVTNTGKITVNGGTGINLYYDNSPTGWRKGNTHFINDGIIEVNKGKGIQVNTNGKVENNNEIIVNNGTTGVTVNGDNSFFTNNETGKIIVTGTNSKGIEITKGEAENKGIINVANKGTGAYVNGATAILINNGKVTVENKDSKGIQLNNGGTAINNGVIKVSKEGAGVQFYQTGGVFTNAKDGVINVVDKGSKGIYLNGEGRATNEGRIVVGKDFETGEITSQVEGVNVNNDNGSFINKNIIETYGENTKGIAIYKGTATNEGTIIAREKSAGVYLANANGSFTNEENGTIIADGKGSKAIQFGTGATNATNKGTIIAQNSADGIFLSADKVGFTNGETGKILAIGTGSKAINLNNKGAKATNDGIIEVSGGATAVENKGTFINNKTIQGSGIGVKLNGGILVNSGTIDTTGNAIESYSGTNNIVYLKNGSKINGKIVGNTGIDVLALEGKDGEYSNLDVSSYEAISVRNGNATISDSTIGLEYNSGTKGYLDTSKSELDKLESSTTMKADNSGKLTMKNSDLIIDFKDSLTNPDATENPIIDAGELHFTGNTSFAFVSSDGRNEFDVNEALGIDKIDTTGMKLETTAVWDYTITDDGKITAKKQDYIDVVTKSELNGFVNVLDDLRSSLGKDFTDVVGKAELLETEEEFTKAMAQMSGGLHGYTVDIAAINSRNLVNTMKNRALTRDYLTARPVNSWYQDVVYLNNNQRLNGLMSGNYQESGVLGVSEKQSLSNGRLGFVYGGSKGKAKFDGGESGEIKNDNIYIGLYYNHDFSEKLALNTNFSFVYGNNTVDRKVKFSDVDYSFSTTYPTYAMGIGTSAIYTIKDDAKNKASFYAGIDVNRIMQGNINEDGDKKDGQANKFAIKSVPADENSYYSITPSAGFMFQNTGYIFDKKYLIGTDLAWETELGNIKDGKRLNMQKGSDNKYTPEYKVGTMQRENVFSTSIFGQLDMTESLALNGRYTSSISDDYDADMLTLGMTYKMDTMADTPILGPILSGLENTKLSSDRWTGTFALMMESEDDSNRAYYDSMGNLMSGDYATSTKMKPKFTLSLRDKQTKWSYYFEGYYMANDFLKDTKSGEADQRATRLHGEARWSDSYSKGRYGLNIGYRNETSNKPALSAYPEPQRIERGVHQLRLTPNFSYNLGSGFRLDMKTTGIFEYNYTGLLEGQMDFLMENEHYLVYTGFMPRWQLRMGYYREDRWMDHDSKKLQWKNNEVTEVAGAGRYQMNQLRPSATYYIGNGDSVTLALRIPVGNGAWYNEVGTDKKDSESYETRYTVNYNHVVTPGFNIFGELTFLDIKTKVTKENDRKVSRSYSFRPTVGFSYSF